MRYAHDATTGPRVVHSVAELQMALADKARGAHIQRLRQRKRLTQQAMAEKLGIAYRTYQTWESGTMPEWPNLEKLALALGTTPERLIGDDEIPEPSQLDRIEAKLDELLELLRPSGTEGPDAVLETEAGRLDEQRRHNGATSKRTPAKRKAS